LNVKGLKTEGQKYKGSGLYQQLHLYGKTYRIYAVVSRFRFRQLADSILKFSFL
jgi:hypothetical protein